MENYIFGQPSSITWIVHRCNLTIPFVLCFAPLVGFDDKGVVSYHHQVSYSHNTSTRKGYVFHLCPSVLTKRIFHSPTQITTPISSWSLCFTNDPTRILTPNNLCKLAVGRISLPIGHRLCFHSPPR